jgi:hypothetical protein
MTDTAKLAQRLVASAERKEMRLPLSQSQLDFIVSAISQGHAPVIQNYVACELAKALLPLQMQLEEIEKELRQRKSAGRR